LQPVAAAAEAASAAINNHPNIPREFMSAPLGSLCGSSGTDRRDLTRVSLFQWADVLGILRTQGDRLDRAHVDRWATLKGVDDLLTPALAET
jgi:hypothetical protein